jgi:ADP-L-glycero-D-manno-heptose 6-epimerase
MRVFVTGATGFVGTNLCLHLKEHGDDVFPLCNHTGLISDTFGHNAVFNSIFGFNTDVLKQVDGIIHLAANNDTVSKQGNEMIESNFYDSKRLLGLALKYNHKFFVYASSTAVYGKQNIVLDELAKPKPLNIYAKSKLKFDKYIQKLSPPIKWAGLRLCNVYGPYEESKGRRMSYLGQMLNKMLEGRDIELFEDGKQQRDWVFVKDVCQAFRKACYTTQNGIFNIGSGQSISFKDLFELLSIHTKYTKGIQWIPNRYEKQYQHFTEVNWAKSNSFFDYTPDYTLDKGIEEYIDFKKNKQDV